MFHVWVLCCMLAIPWFCLREDTVLKRRELQGKRRTGSVDLKQYSCKRFAKVRAAF